MTSNNPSSSTLDSAPQADEGLVFYTHPMSRGRIVRWMLEECGAPYRTEILEYGKAMKSPQFLRINPMGKVPAVREGDVVVTETAAICAWLADRFPGRALAPAPGSAARATWYRWLFFAAGPLEAAVTARALGLLAPPQKSATAGYGRFEDVLTTLEHAVSSSRYVCGDRFTAADLYLASQLNWGMMFGTIERRPAFERYVRPIMNRPAAERAQAADDALIAQRRAAAS